jgi:hypothetical protein
MSEPLWCEVRQHYCRCHDFGKRCDDFDERAAPQENKVDAAPSGSSPLGSSAHTSERRRFVMARTLEWMKPSCEDG